MSVLNGKRIVLGVSGGIAAYKTAPLVRLFIKSGAEVKVIMTPASKDFVTPLTLSTLSKNPVYSNFYDKESENKLWNNHVELGLWADFMLIAPATANTLSKTANGVCNNLLIATYLSAKCPVYFAPAMDLDMYKHSSTQSNFKKLQGFGNIIIPSAFGELASGLTGKGRMAEPEDIINFIKKDIISKLPLRNKKIMITAGPTYEAIDPVRFIGNHSSGKMGFAIAHAAANLGAEVYLVSGPSHQKTTNSLIQRIDVTSAEEMYNACCKIYKNADIAICSAAVADYKPKNVSDKKIKKKNTNLYIDLEPTTDILKSLGKIKKHQFLVGFALETDNELENAKEKIRKKNLDAIVLNSLRDKGAGFAGDTNKITIIDKNFNEFPFPLKSKVEVAEDIVGKIVEWVVK